MKVAEQQPVGGPEEENRPAGDGLGLGLGLEPLGVFTSCQTRGAGAETLTLALASFLLHVGFVAQESRRIEGSRC